jgi:hypothetical protein
VTLLSRDNKGDVDPPIAKPGQQRHECNWHMCQTGLVRPDDNCLVVCVTICTGMRNLLHLHCFIYTSLITFERKLTFWYATNNMQLTRAICTIMTNREQYRRHAYTMAQGRQQQSRSWREHTHEHTHVCKCTHRCTHTHVQTHMHSLCTQVPGFLARMYMVIVN